MLRAIAATVPRTAHAACGARHMSAAAATSLKKPTENPDIKCTGVDQDVGVTDSLVSLTASTVTLTYIHVNT